jgi:hypothetical protein
MDGTLIFTFIFGLLLFVIIKIAVKAPGRTLQKKFVALGNMSQLTKDDIINAVGQPNSISNSANGQLLQWIATGYHMSILFDNNGRFIKIQHQFASK